MDPQIVADKRRHGPGEPKPDGWHVYHICDGALREINAIGTVSGPSPSRDLTCVHCGQWLSMKVNVTGV